MNSRLTRVTNQEQLHQVVIISRAPRGLRHLKVVGNSLRAGWMHKKRQMCLRTANVPETKSARPFVT
eukprot:750036-Hanusia_phi.AAC.2